MDQPANRRPPGHKQDLLNLADGALARDLYARPSRDEVLHHNVPVRIAKKLALDNDSQIAVGLGALGAVIWRLDVRAGRVEISDSGRQLFTQTLGLDSTCLDESRYGFATHAHPDDRDRILALLANGIERPVRTHFRVIDNDGEIRWIHLKVVHSSQSPFFDSADDSLWFFAENQTSERGEEERQKRLLADRILATLLGSSLESVEPTHFESRSLIESVGGKWQPLIEAKHIRWIGPDAAPTGLPSQIMGSELLIQIILDAMFENALDALTTNPGLHAWVRFELFEDDESLFLAVSDSGPGVPLIHRGSVFDPFFSTHPERSSGLGLTLARSAAEWHGGTLRLDHFSKNTRFIAQIPKRFRAAIKNS